MSKQFSKRPKNSKGQISKPKAKFNNSKISRMLKENNLQDALSDELEQKGKDLEKGKYRFPRGKAVHKSNDPQWYYKSDDLLSSVASFSYAKPLGTQVLSTDDVYTKISNWNTIPGLMTIKLAPTVGYSTDASSPINLGAQNVYTRVRYKNAGAANYDAPDLMMYYVAMSSLYSMWNWMKRIYGYASEYSQTNTYKAVAYAKSENIDLEDLVKHLASYRTYLSMAADRISAFCVPAVFTYMTRQSWLYSNIYKDSDTMKAQEYMFTPGFFYVYDETSYTTGSTLVPLDVNVVNKTNLYKTTDLMNMLNTAINALQYSSDIGNMSGDTLKEFGGNLFMLSHIDPDYKCTAVYDREVLTQIENAQWSRSLAGYTNTATAAQLESLFTIKHDPNTNYIKSELKYTAAGYDLEDEGLKVNFMNFHWENPSPADMMVASRLNCIQVAPSTNNFQIVSCGSEVVLSCTAWMWTYGNDIDATYTLGTPRQLNSVTLDSLIFGNPSQNAATPQLLYRFMKTAMKTLYAWNAFDWAPPLYAVINPDLSTGSTFASYFQIPPLRDWDVYTRVEHEQVESMNTLALLSMFNVPN